MSYLFGHDSMDSQEVEHRRSNEMRSDVTSDVQRNGFHTNFSADELARLHEDIALGRPFLDELPLYVLKPAQKARCD